MRFLAFWHSGKSQNSCRLLRRITAYAREHEDNFVQQVTKQNEKEIDRQLRDNHKELEQAKNRIAKLDIIVQRLYEDNIDGKVTDERFSRMSATYEAEQKQLENRVSELQSFIDTAKQQRLNVNSFLTLVKRYTEIPELTAEIIRAFVEKIEVFQPEKIPGTTERKQTVKIHWNYVGAVDIPEEQRKTA